MSRTPSLAVALASAGLAFATTPVLGEDNAPAGDRQVVAKLIRDAVVPEAAKAKIEGKSDQRHREVLKNPIQDIVTYWRSEVSGTATFVEPDKKLTVEVPGLVRKKGVAVLTVKAEAPIKGTVAGKALTDDGITIISVESPYTCTLAASADCRVTRVAKDGAVAYSIEVTRWEPSIRDLSFTGELDRVKGPIEGLANDRLKAEAARLRDEMNAALKKAYEDGRLTLPD
jgi:hypothetical protein